MFSLRRRLFGFGVNSLERGIGLKLGEDILQQVIRFQCGNLSQDRCLIGTGVAAGATVPLATEALADSEKEDEKKKARYRESDEVKAYYRVNRYPS